MNTPVISLYGIPNCDTVRKARAWLRAHDQAYHFHDLRQDGLQPDTLAHWCAQAGWETLLNRRSSSWRQLDASVRAQLNADQAQTLMLQHPTLIKRPVLAYKDQLKVGFQAEAYKALLLPDSPA